MDKKRFKIVIFIIFIFLVLISYSFLYYNGKLKVEFVSGSEDKYLTKYVSRNSKVKRPNDPIKEGYAFVEWQLNGEKFDFNSNITKNITLTAKWAKKEYVTIKFELDGNIIDEKTILKGTKVEEIDALKKENYIFDGWFLNDELFDFSKEIHSDIILKAKFTEIKYEIGDIVLIKDSYASSSFDDDATNTIAIGWEREILDIYPEANYPYMLGNNEGITGFFNKESIQKK